MTGRVWRITSNDTYSCGLHNIGHLLHTLPTTCLMRDSNLSTRGHIRREYHRPRRASFIEVTICLYRCTNHTFFHLSICRNHFVHSHQTLCHYRKIGQRKVFSLWHRITRRGDDAYAEHARWSPYCVFLTFVKGKPFIEECRRLARQNGAGDILTVALNELINLKYTPRNYFFINPIPEPMSQEMIILKSMYSPVDGYRRTATAVATATRTQRPQ